MNSLDRRVGSENFPVHPNSLFWDKCSNTIALQCSQNVEMIKPFINSPGYTFNVKDDTFPFEPMNIYTHRDKNETKLMKDYSIIHPIQFKDYKRSILSVNFCPESVNGRKFICILTSDGLVKILESGNVEAWECKLDLFSEISSQSFGLPEGDVESDTGTDFASINYDRSNWEYVSKDAEIKIGYDFRFRVFKENIPDEYFQRLVKKKERVTKKKKEKEGFDENVPKFGTGNALNVEDLNNMYKIFHNEFLTKIDDADVEMQDEKPDKKRWVAFNKNQKRAFDQSVEKMWEDCKELLKEKSYNKNRVEKEIRRRLRYYMRTKEELVDDVLKLPRGIIEYNYLLNYRGKRKKHEDKMEKKRNGKPVKKRKRKREEKKDDDSIPDIPLLTSVNEKENEKKRKVQKTVGGKDVSNVLYISKVDCMMSTCMSWCKRVEVDEGWNYLIAIGSKAGMVNFMKIVIPNDDSEVKYEFIKYVKVDTTSISMVKYFRIKDQEFLLTSSSSGDLKLWKFSSNDCSLVFFYELMSVDDVNFRFVKTYLLNECTYVVFTKGPKVIVIKINESFEVVWKQTLDQHVAKVTGVCLSETINSNLLVYSCSYEGLLIKWEVLQDGRFRFEVMVNKSKDKLSFWGLDWSPNKTFIAINYVCRKKMSTSKVRHNEIFFFPVVRSNNDVMNVFSLIVKERSNDTNDFDVVKSLEIMNVLYLKHLITQFLEIGKEKKDNSYFKLTYAVLSLLSTKVLQDSVVTNSFVQTLKDLKAVLYYVHISNSFNNLYKNYFGDDPQVKEIIVRFCEWIVAFNYSLIHQSITYPSELKFHFVADLENLKEVYKSNSTYVELVESCINFHKTGALTIVNFPKLLPNKEDACPICGEHLSMNCQNLKSDKNYFYCSQGHIFNRDIFDLKVIHNFQNLKYCGFCNTKTLDVEQCLCPICDSKFTKHHW